MKHRRHPRWWGLAAAVALAGCQEAPAREEPPATTAAPPAATPAPATPTTTAAASADKPPEKPVVELRLEVVGNKMEFDKKLLKVKAGSRVKVVLHNTATLAVMKHNWVLAKPGTGDKVGLAGTKKGEPAGFIDPSPDILAHTPLCEIGKTVEVVFDAPEVGTYPYVCTVAGHYVMMKGVLVVEP